MALLLTWWVTRAALHGPFVFDDFPNLAHLDRIGGQFTLARLADYLQAFIGDPGRPLSALSFLIDDTAWPSTPYGFKRTNLLLHLLGGVLVFAFVRGVARGLLDADRAALAAALASAAWLLHPMQLSTSMLVVQRMTQLMALTSLAALWWASAYVQRAPLTVRRSLGLLAGLGLATIAAFLCKENGALLPLYAGVVLFVLLRDHLQAGTPGARTLLAAGLTLPVVAVVAYIASKSSYGTAEALRDFGPGERLLTQARVLIEYLGRIALPRLDGSGLFHDDFEASRGLLQPGTTLPAVLFCLGLLGAALALRRRAPLFSFAVLWYFGGHLIEASTLPLELYFEHRNYLPMVGPLAAMAIAIARLPAEGMRRTYLAAAVAWIALCAGITFVQAKVWASEAMLAAIWADESPGSARAVELQAKVLADGGHYDVAYETLERAMQARPELRRLSLDLVLLDCMRGSLTRDRLIDAGAHALDAPFNRSSLEALSTLLDLSIEGGCGAALDVPTWRDLAQAFIARPLYAGGEVGGYLWIQVARSYLAEGNLPAANQALEAAYTANPDSELARRAYILSYDNGACAMARKWWPRQAPSARFSFDAWLQARAFASNGLAPPETCGQPATLVPPAGSLPDTGTVNPIATPPSG
ncbi:hypothetical protein [Luteimonas vadosa]|uniref:hypothetical protein n=1 Tax=Luteimonas vadosa TaxID=1165507 RepID=UPI0031E793D2